MDAEVLKNYLQKNERQTGSDIVLLSVEHNLIKRIFLEITFHLDNDIEQIRDQIYLMTGTSPQWMELKYLNQVLEDGKTLRDYIPAQYGTIHCIDHDPHSLAKDGGLDDTSKIVRTVMSDEEYDKRPDTYRAWKRKQLEQNPKFVPSWIIKQREQKAAQILANGPIMTIEEAQAKYPIGARVECSPGGRRGEIKYVGYLGAGPITYNDGYIEPVVVWIGVLLDDPEGKNDGTFNGKRYFEATQGFGGFFRPQFVEVGDFPFQDPFDFSDEEL